MTGMTPQTPHWRYRLAIIFSIAVVPLAFGTSASGLAGASDPVCDVSEIWVAPAEISRRDVFNGPWGAENAPRRDAVYRFIEWKGGGINPGMTVEDPEGREWKVKQPPNTGCNAEGPIEVVLSRVLSAVGYHQPPVYFLPALLVDNGRSVYQTVGGRFRLKHPTLKDKGDWKWREHPCLGTAPHHGLLVILLMFNSSDLKDSNNTLYHYTPPGSPQYRRWFVVRDLGTALGNTARIAPIRGDADVFERLGFIKRVHNGLVEFHYSGRHQDLVDRRIRPSDVHWAAKRLAQLSHAQWHDAFRAGGYDEPLRQRFIDKLQSKVRDGLALPPTGEP